MILGEEKWVSNIQLLKNNSLNVITKFVRRTHMKILNIHGYKGSSCNSVYTALKNLDCEVISPEIDYDAKPPERVLEELHRLIDENHVDVVVGTSLGGFYAAVLSAQLNLPVILVNPCLMPFIYLSRLGYTRDVKPYMAMFGELLKLKSYNVSTVVGGQDEIIDTLDFTEQLLQKGQYVVVPDGKHSGATLSLDVNLPQLLAGISFKCSG